MNMITILNAKGECWKGKTSYKTYKSVKSAKRAIKTEKARAKWHNIDFYTGGLWEDHVKCFGIVEAKKNKAEGKREYKKRMAYLDACYVKEWE